MFIDWPDWFITSNDEIKSSIQHRAESLSHSLAGHHNVSDFTNFSCFVKVKTQQFLYEMPRAYNSELRNSVVSVIFAGEPGISVARSNDIDFRTVLR